MNLWVDLRAVPVKRRVPFLRIAAEVGARCIVAAADPDAGRAGVLATDGDAIVGPRGRMATWVPIDGPEDERKARDVAGTIVVTCSDWTVIPLENLVAARRDRPGTLWATAEGLPDVRLLLGILETGVHGIVLRPGTAAEIKEAADTLGQKTPADGPGIHAPKSAAGAPLVLAHIVAMDDAGMADRVCLDTTQAFQHGEGILVGSTARSFCLVAAETAQSGYVAPRPFRVNAGALHAYTLAPDGTTRYLSELRAGDRLMAMRPDGTTFPVTLGRAKIEPRPHLLVRWDGDGQAGSMVLQRAETVRLATPDGPVAITHLAIGDRILVHEETAARHLGMSVDGRLEER